MGTVEYSKLRAERDQQVGQLTAERERLETTPDAELDELTELYVVLAALALTGWVSARISDVRPVLPMVRTAGIGGLSMLITFFAGHVLYP